MVNKREKVSGVMADFFLERMVKKMKNIRQKGWYYTLHVLFVILPILLLAIEAIYVIYISAIGKTDVLETIKKIIAPALVQIGFAYAGKLVDDYLEAIERDSELKEIKDKIEQLVPNVTSLSNEIRNFNNASIEVLSQHEDFYSKLTKCRLCATLEVLLTQLDPNPPESYEDESKRKSYFDSDIEYAKSHPHVTIKRILSIETEEKMEWVRGLIDATKDLPNLFLAFVNIENIAKERPFPKMLSLQIIDRNEVFVLNPQYSYMPKSYQPCFYLKNRDVAQIFVDYHTDIWRELERDSENNEYKHGCILKEGKEIHIDRLDKICLKRGWKNTKIDLTQSEIIIQNEGKD